MGNETDTGGAHEEWPGGIETTIARVTASRGPPTTDVVFDLLSRSHRRFVLYCLRHTERPLDVPTLADRVADLIEASASTASTDYNTLCTRLNHTTLPRLADAGVIDYDQELGIIEGTDAISAMEPLLDLAAQLDFESEPTALENCLTE